MLIVVGCGKIFEVFEGTLMQIWNFPYIFAFI